MLKKRALIIGTYDTDHDGLFTLSALELTDPDYQANFQEVPGRDGPLDFSTVLTDGEPRYGSRTLTATLETSEGTRQQRQDRIGRMINTLDGFRWEIRHPDFPAHYLSGRVQVKQLYNDLAHGAVSVTAICDPWLYSRVERVYTLAATTEIRLMALSNRGRRVLVPRVEVISDDETAHFGCFYNDTYDFLGPGVYTLPGLPLRPGDTVIRYGVSENCTVKISYREAVLR